VTGPVRVLCVGRLSPEKGHHGLLQALSELHRTIPPFRLTFIGDGPMRADLEARAQFLGLQDCVEFAGARAEEQVMEALSRAHVFVLPSLMEGLPVVLMEAMAHALPVVAPRVAGIPELVTDEGEGLLFAPSDWPALKLQLRRILTDPDLRKRLGGAGRVRIAEEFTIDRVVEPLWKKLAGNGNG